MLPLDDPRWSEFKGGYRVKYDARPLIRRFERGEDEKECWEEVWQELHHQWDVDLASYAFFPHIVRIDAATRKLTEYISYDVYRGCDETLILSIASFIASSNGHLEISQMLDEIDFWRHDRETAKSADRAN